jgi:hypothetical protein
MLSVKNSNKRISKRKYPVRRCAKPACYIEFIPTHKRQKFCCPQHRIDHNNDRRDEKNKPSLTLEKKRRHNENVLRKVFIKLKELRSDNVAATLLIYEDFNFEVYSDRTINLLSNNEILWSYFYGIEGQSPERNFFKIHHRTKIPF